MFQRSYVPTIFFLCFSKVLFDQSSFPAKLCLQCNFSVPGGFVPVKFFSSREVPLLTHWGGRTRRHRLTTRVSTSLVLQQLRGRACWSTCRWLCTSWTLPYHLPEEALANKHFPTDQVNASLCVLVNKNTCNWHLAHYIRPSTCGVSTVYLTDWGTIWRELKTDCRSSIYVLAPSSYLREEEEEEELPGGFRGSSWGRVGCPSQAGRQCIPLCKREGESLGYTSPAQTMHT